MTACADKILLVHALADGELDAANAVALDAHLATCADCAAELEAITALRTRIAAAPGLREVAPSALRGRIEAIAPPAPARAKPAARARWAWGGGGVLTGALAASLAFAFIAPLPSDRALEDEIVASHVRSLLPGRLIDIQTSDRHVVKPWFNGRIDFAPPVVDLRGQGYPLIGGRLDYVGGRNVAALAFSRDRHVINLLIMPANHGWRTSAPDEQRDGYHILRWRRGDLDYWAISDTDPGALRGFRDAFIAAAH